MELSKHKDGGIETARGFNRDVLPFIGYMAAESVIQAQVTMISGAGLMRGENRLAKRFLSELRPMFGFALNRDVIPAESDAFIKKDRTGGKATFFADLPQTFRMEKNQIGSAHPLPDLPPDRSYYLLLINQRHLMHDLPARLSPVFGNGIANLHKMAPGRRP